MGQARQFFIGGILYFATKNNIYEIIVKQANSALYTYFFTNK